MKRTHVYICIAALLSLAACKKSFLDSEDVTTATEQNFYKTPADVYKALVGTYDGLQRVWSEGVSLPVGAEVMSDNAFGGTGYSDGLSYQMIDEFDKLRSPADVSLFEKNWGAYYKAIYRANMLLSKLDQVKWDGADSMRKIYESETRFLRAYCYFDMVRLWGNIPLVTVPTTENLPQANADSVYRLIADDLKFAAANLPSRAYGKDTITPGRVNKWAAESLIGRVFLYYTGYYNKPDLVGAVSKTQALAYLEDVISNGGYGLVDRFANLWPAASLGDYVGENNKETVFAIKYTYTSDYNGNVDGNHWLVMNGIRVQDIFPYGHGWGGSTVNPKLWNAFETGDTRRAASIISINDELLDFADGKKNQREYTGYYSKKYTPMVDAAKTSVAMAKGGVDFMVGQYQDYVSIRYSDVLLMAAELGAANAQKYFDAVRNRAFGGSAPPKTVSQAAILTERRMEFVGEGHRYWDLLRQGVNVAASTIAETATLQTGGVNTPKTIQASKITETKGLMQIPNSQITLSNNVLKQNAGW